MKFFGRELQFAYTVGAKKEVDRLIAEHGGQSLNDLITGSQEAQEAGTTGVVLIISKWGEKLHAAEEPGYEPRPITPEELDLATLAQNAELFTAALQAMTRDSGRGVETGEEEPQKKTAQAAPSS